MKKWYLKNRETELQKCRDYYWKNREKIRIQKKEYATKHREKILAQRKKYREANREKLRIRDRLHYAKNKSKINARSRNNHLKRNFKISHDDYVKMCERQNFLCLICRVKKELVVDHNHKTGKVRGLLCRGCNSGIGFLQEGKLFYNALKYLEVFNGNSSI